MLIGIIKWRVIKGYLRGIRIYLFPSLLTAIYLAAILLIVLWATSKWNNDVSQISLLRTMIRWKWMPRFLYKIIETGRGQDRGETERECVCVRERGRAWKWRIESAIKGTITENICDRHVKLIKRVEQDVVNDVVPTIYIFSIKLSTTFQPKTSHKFHIIILSLIFVGQVCLY